MNGDPTIGVNALYGVPESDEGPILGRASRPMEYTMRIADIVYLVVECQPELVV